MKLYIIKINTRLKKQFLNNLENFIIIINLFIIIFFINIFKKYIYKILYYNI